MRMRRIVIVGAGVGGLVAALRLAAHGMAVTVVEAAGTPGGKMREAIVGGARIDAGPTVFTMRWVFDEIAREIGVSIDDRLKFHATQILARHAWSGAARLDLFADIDRTSDAIGAFSGARDAEGYRRFCERAKAIHDTLKESFINASRPSVFSLVSRVGLSRIGDLARISPFATLWSELSTYFRDPRLRQLFGRYATYCGSSPFVAPATLMLVAHVEREGVWLIEGGMQRLATVIEELARDCGANFLYGRRVARILVDGGRANGVELADGERLPADAVVMNGDISALAAGLLGPEVTGAVRAPPSRSRSLSAATWALTGKARGFPLMRHNVFFSSDYRREFDDIGALGRLPRSPTVYVCAQDRGDIEPAPGQHADGERLFCLVNAPANGDGDHLQPSDLRSCEEATFRHLDQCGLHVAWRESAMTRTTPADFARLFPGSGGALYGRASHGWMASFSRPGARTRVPGFYLAGGGTHPGPGVPMAALSGRQAALSVMTDLASTGWFRPAGMPGGTSTRSATMDNSGLRSSPSSAASSRPTTPGPEERTRSTIAR
jgi:1-hydroxycarotenoid 3,4-desaturase